MVRGTTTYSYGVSRRESHDATDFYSRFSNPTITTDESITKCPIKNELIVGDARALSMIPDNSISLIVTSPPYFVGKDYEQSDSDSTSNPTNYDEYLELLKDSFSEALRVMEPGARIAINIANLGRKPYRSLSSDVIGILQNEIGFLLRGEILWVKQEGANGNCAWGSFAKASNPILRDTTERIIVASKGRFDRAINWRQRKTLGHAWESTISKENFMSWTLDVWKMQPASAKRIGHPAPFPVELPRRLIELYTYKNDNPVLDMFCGSGTTAEAAIRSERPYIGVDSEKAYIDLAETRLQKIHQELQCSD